MKLQIAFELTDLKEALKIAKKVEPYVDIMEVGSLLIASKGTAAVKKFNEKFPETTILANTKIIEQSKESVDLFSETGAHWITALAGTTRSVIHRTTSLAHEAGQKVMLNLIDASSLGQIALEAKSLGVDALVFHKPLESTTEMEFLDDWEMVRGNTDLPIYVSGPINRDNVHQVLQLSPDGIIIENAIINAENPAEEAEYFHKLINQ